MFFQLLYFLYSLSRGVSLHTEVSNVVVKETQDMSSVVSPWEQQIRPLVGVIRTGGDEKYEKKKNRIILCMADSTVYSPGRIREVCIATCYTNVSTSLSGKNGLRICGVNYKDNFRLSSPPKKCTSQVFFSRAWG